MDYLQIRTIDGQLYGVRAMPVKTSAPLGIKIARLLGPFMAKMADPVVAKSPVSSPLFAEALENLFARLDESDSAALMDKLLAYIERDGIPIAQTYNTDYAGKLGVLFQILKFAVEAQFGGFSAGFGAGAAAEPKAVQPKGAAASSGK